jgi:hypothetical protein
LSDLGRPWTRGTVHQVLTNEKYVGNNVYNRISFKLKKKRVANPPDMWIRANGAFTPIVEPILFQAVRRIIQERSRRYSDQEMLERLTTLLNQTGSLSGLVIAEHDDMPSSSAYRARFGSPTRLPINGYSPGRDYDYVEINRVLRTMHPEVIAEAVTAIEKLGGTIRRDAATDLLTINDEFTASIVIGRAFQTLTGALRWKIRLDGRLRPDITVALRMDQANRQVLDYSLLPPIDIAPAKLRLEKRTDSSSIRTALTRSTVSSTWQHAHN